MRNFYLHTIDKSKTFNLNTPSALAAEPTGLGNAFATEYKDSNDGKHLVNVKPSFDPIKLKVYFNSDGSNGYVNYKSLMSFLAMCGTSSFLFEYDDGVTNKFCEVVSKTMPKSEINDEGIFAEEFTFERQTFWYEEIEQSFSLKKTQNEMGYPLQFPFSFEGVTFTKEYLIKNQFFIKSPVDITIKGKITNNVQVYIKDATTGEIVSQIQLSTGNSEGTVITIRPTTKKILVEDSDGNITNGYGLTDKTKQSFLYLPQGSYYIGSNMNDEDTGEITISIKRYLFD